MAIDILTLALAKKMSGGIEVTGAEVGQTIVVKAVDDNSKPTEWETRDFPDSGGNVDQESIAQAVSDYMEANPVVGAPGADGKDGVSATHSWNGTVLTVTSASGTSSANLKGDKGDKGDTGATGGKGADGVSVSSVKQTTTSSADGGSNVVTVTLSNGTTSTFTVMNGSKGSSGSNGTNGKDGKTPVRGTDYWTEADKASMIQDVISALGGSPIFGVVDANNNIILTGTLADGTYTLKYEDDEGNTHEIGTVTLGEKMINQIPISTDTDGVTIFNGTGWKTGERVSSSGAIKTQASYELTGFMPFVKGDVLRGSAYILLREAITDVSNANYNVISLYDVNKTFITNVSLALSSAAPAGVTFGADRSFVFDSSLNSDVTDAVKFIRVTCAGISNGNTLEAIITINQEIE